jgi:tetratricopeptide (TPR) repeat protein
MAKKKKKLNKQLAAAVACVAIIGGVVGIGGIKLYRDTYRPAQFKKEGRALMLKGDYEGAFKTFARAAGGGRLNTDMEFLGWFYETTLHRTSFSDTALRDCSRLLDAMLATRPNDVPTVVRKLEFDLDLLDAGGVERFDQDQAKRIADLAGRVLTVEPTNPTAMRADALATALPVFKQDTSLTSADIEAVQQALAKKLDAAPDNADLLSLYTMATVRLREVLVRERAIEAGADVPRVKEMLSDLNARSEKLIAFAAEESRPAEQRATIYARVARADQILLAPQTNFVAEADTATRQKMFERRLKSIEQAAAIVPASSEIYIPLRIEYGTILTQQEKTDEAEKVYKATVDGAPKQWQPRLFLADFYSDRGRFAEALDLVKTDLQPDADLQGLAGAQFLLDRRAVPLRRAFYRLQASGSKKPDDRAAEVAVAQADYDLALADGKISDTEPYALQVKAALQELKLDRTGAMQTLTKALEALPPGANDRLRLKIQQQLVSLNLAMNQPGAASAMLEQMIRNSAQSPQMQLNTVIQTIDLHIRNGQTEAARVLLNAVKGFGSLAKNPAIIALEIKMMTDPNQKIKALAEVGEDTPQLRAFKMKFAGELKDEATMRRLAEATLKEDPGQMEVAMLWGDYLRRNGKRDEAVKVFQAALDKHPGDQNMAMLIKDTQAVTAEQRADVIGGLYEKDPYRRTMFEADRARVANRLDEYEKKLLEAEPLDENKDGAATERLALYYMALGDGEKATKSIDKLANMNRDPAQIRVLRARLALATGKNADAIAQAESITSDLPSFSPGWIMRGQAFQVNNQPNQAIESFETALGLQPDNLEALRGIIENAERVGRRDVLKRYIDQGLRQTRNTDEYFVDWSLRYELAYGDPTVTIEPRLKQRDAAPEDGGRWLALAQSYLASANAKERAGDGVAAADYRSKGLDVFAKAYEKFPKAHGFQLQAAEIIAKGGDVKRATAMMDAVGQNADLSAEVQSSRARFYATYGQPDQAIKLLSDQIAAGKADDSVRMQLAQVQSSAGDVDGALRTLESATDVPAIREARMNLFLAARRTDEAWKLVSDALAKERTGPTLLMAALVEGQRSHLPEALKLADEAVALDADSAPARYTRARLYLSQRPARNNDAIADLQVVRKNQPGNIDARLMLADRLRAVGRRDESTQELETMSADFDNDRRVAIPLIQAYAVENPPRYARIDQVLTAAKRTGGGSKDPQLLMLESAVASQRGDNQRAVRAAKEATDAAPQEIGLYRSMLTIMLRAQAYKEVLAEVDRKQKENPSLYWTYLIHGVVMHRTNNEPEAAKDFDRAIGLASALKDSNDALGEVGTSYAGEYGAEAAADWIKSKLPDEVNTRVLQMRLLMSSGKTEKAIVVGKQVMDSMQSLPKAQQIQILSTMGTAYLTAQPPQPENAKTVFARLNEMEPNNMMTLNNLAYAMTLTGSGASMQEAVDIAKQANDLAQATAQPNPFVMDTYGWTLVQAGKTDDGLAVLRQALEAGALPETEYHIGEVYITQGQKDAAMTTLQSALARVTAPSQNGQAPDTALLARINDAISRAKLMP